MDNTPVLTFSPDRRYTVFAVGGAVLAVAGALLADDRAGRLLFVLAAAALLCYVVTDLVFSPRLVVTAGGVAINSPFVRTRLAWDDIEAIRADTRVRRGIRSTTLEIDAGPVLAVLTRRSLNADPADAASRAEALRPIGRSPGRAAPRHHDDDHRDDGH